MTSTHGWRAAKSRERFDGTGTLRVAHSMQTEGHRLQ